jgi:hypothetical protein
MLKCIVECALKIDTSNLSKHVVSKHVRKVYENFTLIKK